MKNQIKLWQSSYRFDRRTPGRAEGNGFTIQKTVWIFRYRQRQSAFERRTHTFPASWGVKEDDVIPCSGNYHVTCGRGWKGMTQGSMEADMYWEICGSTLHKFVLSSINTFYLDCFPKPVSEETLISDGNGESNQTFQTLISNLGCKFPGKLSSPSKQLYSVPPSWSIYTWRHGGHIGATSIPGSLSLPPLTRKAKEREPGIEVDIGDPKQWHFCPFVNEILM